MASNGHWILLEAIFVEGALRIYDSLGRRGRRVADHLIAGIRRQGIRRQFAVRFPGVPKQTNSQDYGVFVCEHALRLPGRRGRGGYLPAATRGRIKGQLPACAS